MAPLTFVSLLVLICSAVYGRVALTMPLREAAAKRGTFIGAEVGYPQLINESDPTFNRVVGEQYDLTTPGNACKWAATEPVQDVYSFTECDYVYRFARSKNMSFRGHVLCWGLSSSKTSVFVFVSAPFLLPRNVQS